MNQGIRHARVDTETASVAREDIDGTAADARRARFGRLPDPVRVKDMAEERPATAQDPARHAYDPHDWLVRHCA